jgi:hemolysin
VKKALPRFTPDLLRLAIATSLLAPATAWATPALQPASGPGGTPQVNPHNGVPVIDIVPPSASGLSHNQFLDYNVGQPGVVLNNSVQAGQSQLAGALGANPQFQGQAASTILNEVISRNASTIEGPQEIFGKPADYILANPNGITINGGSFINTTRSTFLAGRPELEDQRIKYLDSRNASGEVTVGAQGLVNAEGALSLIAPRIHTRGELDTPGDLDVIIGRNRLDHASGQVVEHLPGTPGGIDASLFGAMQAGRIRIISTAEGAGVRIEAPQMRARDGLSVRSAGDLDIHGTPRQRSRMAVDNGNLDLHANGDMRLSAVEGHADRIEAKAGKRLTLDGKTREKITRDREKWDKKWWFVTTETYDRQRTTTERTNQGSELCAGDSIELYAGDDLRLRNASVKAGGDLVARSDTTLDIGAAIDSVQVDESIRHRKHLWRGDQDKQDYRETARGSELSGRNLKLEGAQRTVVAGSTLRSERDITVKTPELDVGVVEQGSRDSSKQYRGDLVSGTFFGNRDDSQGNAAKSLGSQVDAGGAITVVADKVQVSGSRIASKGDALLASEKAALNIDAAYDTSSRSTSSSDSKVFGLIKSSSERQQQNDTVLVSDVASDSNLRLASADELRVIGAKLQAGGALKLEAAKDLTVGAASETRQQTGQDVERGFYAKARETVQAGDGKPGSKQYTASVGYQVTRKDSSDQQTTLVPSQLSAGSIELASQANVAVDSSKLDAGRGAIDISGQQITLGAQRNEQRQESTTTHAGGGLAATGGMDRIGSGQEGFHQRQGREELRQEALSSELKAAGDIRLKTPNLVNEAAKIDAGGELLVEAKEVENRATAKVHEVRESQTNWEGQLGASLEIRDLARPIENLVTGNEAARFQQAATEDAFSPPSIGADLALDHLNRQETRRSETATVSELNAASVKVKADTVSDTGTRYHASNGTVSIEAQNHQLVAAQDSTRVSTERLDVNGALRVETTTGKDIAVRLSGKGGSLSETKDSVVARPGSLYGQQGIQVQLGSDGLYEGTTFDGGAGSVTLDAGGDLSLTQASDRQQHDLRQLDGNGWVKAGTTPATKGAEVRGYLDHKQNSSSDSQARVASIDAQGKVQLTSGGQTTLVGTRIGDPKARPTDIVVDAQGPLRVLAATDTHEANGRSLGGGGEGALKMAETGNGGGLGGHFSNGRIDETSSKATGAVLTAKDSLVLRSQDHSDTAVHLQGVQASAGEIVVSAENGGILAEATSSSEHRDNLDITAGAGIARTQAQVKADTKKALYGRAQFNLDQLDSLQHLNSELNGQHVSFNSLNDTQLKGVRVNAGRVDGQIGGDLLLASQVDRINGLKLDVDARLSQEKNPQGYLNAVKSFSGPAGAGVEKKIGSTVQKVDPGFSPTLEVKVDHRQLETVAQPSRMVGAEGIALEVAGEVRLSGADLRAPRGEVTLGTDRVSTETLAGRDYRRVVGTNLSNAPAELGTDLVNTYKDGMGLEPGDSSVDLGLFRTGGHDRNVSVESNVIGRK